MIGQVRHLLHRILFQPQFQSQGIDAIQVISKESFVADEAQFLVQVKSWTVGDLRLQYHLYRYAI